MQINHATHPTNIGGAIASNALQGIPRETLSSERLEYLQNLAQSISERLANALRLDSTSALFDRPRELMTRIQNATTLLFASVDFAKKYNLGAVNFLHYSQITELLVKLGDNKEFLTIRLNLFSYLELVVKNAKANLSIYDGNERSILDKEKAMKNVGMLLKVIERLEPDIKAANLSADIDLLKSRFLNHDLLPNNRSISSGAARYIKII